MKSVDTSKFDMEALATMKPIYDSHSLVNGGELAQNMPLTSDDLAQMIIFLASDRTHRVSGSIIPVDNAWSTI